MAGITIYEFDALVEQSGMPEPAGFRYVPADTFAWLQSQALRASDNGGSAWLRFTQRSGRLAVQVKSFVGVVRAPDGFQIEVLPKVAKAIGGGDGEARQLLIEMLRCLGEFRHIPTDSARLNARRMPLLEVFISEFLRAVEHVVKRGLWSDYAVRQANIFALRGKLHVAGHMRQNICRRDRFFAEYEEFSTDRPENRLMHSALKRTLLWTTSQPNEQSSRELGFVFADVPPSDQPSQDFERVRLDRGMAHYDRALAWARLILRDESPLTGSGKHFAPSLLFPMEAVFEAFVAKHLARQLIPGCQLRTQPRSFSLVRHRGQDWFRLKPDLLVHQGKENRLVLDTKWKLLDDRAASGTEKYGLDQGDIYQLHAYGQSYLGGRGDVVLIYPRTEVFSQALPVFEFPKAESVRLWVLPFCLRERKLILPACGSLDEFFVPGSSHRGEPVAAAPTDQANGPYTASVF